jgi:predicted DNA-binding transcriptional regulator YafY
VCYSRTAMPRGDQVARLYTLVMDLARTKRGLTADTLARRRDRRVRTVYRDLHALETAGFPITSGDGARWRLVDGWEARVPFPLPLGQLLALHVARDLMQPLRGTPLAREFQALCDRLAGPPRDAAGPQGELFPRLRAILATRSQLAIDYTEHSALLETLCAACERRTTVRAVYYTETRRELTRREVDPYCLYYDPQLEALYVFAWCHVRRALRTFAVHRFRQARLTEKTFESPAGFSAEAYLRGAFRMWRGENTITARVAIDPEGAGWVTERRWHASQQVRRQADGGCVLSFTLDGVRELRRFVLQLGAAAEVLEPDWLRQDIAAEHTRAAQRYRRRPAKKVSLDDTGVSHTGRGS